MTVGDQQNYCVYVQITNNTTHNVHIQRFDINHLNCVNPKIICEVA